MSSTLIAGLLGLSCTLEQGLEHKLKKPGLGASSAVSLGAAPNLASSLDKCAHLAVF